MTRELAESIGQAVREETGQAVIIAEHLIEPGNWQVWILEDDATWQRVIGLEPVLA
jgi:hypothetical protein